MSEHAPDQPKNPLHGLTLAMIVTELAEHYGWEELGQQVRIQCFNHEPSVASSLKFLRRTPWAREKVESFYLFHLRAVKRGDAQVKTPPHTPQPPPSRDPPG